MFLVRVSLQRNKEKRATKVEDTPTSPFKLLPHTKEMVRRQLGLMLKVIDDISETKVGSGG